MHGRRSRTLAAAVALSVVAVPAMAQQPDLSEVREQLVIVRTFDAMGRALGDISGFAVGGAFVATGAALLVGAEEAVVVLPETRDEFPAAVVVLEQRSGVAVLRAEGLEAEGLRFAATDAEPQQGHRLYIPRFAPDGTIAEEAAPGSVSELRIIEPTAIGERDVLLYRHNALATARQYGMPLLNDCAEAVGQLRTDPDISRTTLNARPDPGPAPFAVSAAAIREVIAEAGGEPRLAEEPCLDPVAVAETAVRAAEQAAARAEAAAAEAEAAGEERDLALEEAQAAQTAAEQSQAEREAAEAAAQQLARQRRWLAAAVILGLVAAVAVVLLLVQRLRRRRDALSASEEALKSALRPAAFSCLLDGADKSGRGYAVKISAEQLGDSSGVVVGRNPAQAGALLDHPEASREHFRLTARGDELVVTDLHSTNGTFVDGERLEAGAKTAVADGAAIGVGSAITLRLTIQQAGTRPSGQLADRVAQVKGLETLFVDEVRGTPKCDLKPTFRDRFREQVKKSR